MDRLGGKHRGGGSCSECHEQREKEGCLERREIGIPYEEEGSSGRESEGGIVEEDPRRPKRESIFILRGETILRQ